MDKQIVFEDIWSGATDCLHCALRTSVLFAGLEQADFERIHEPIDHLILEPQEALYRAGDQGEYMYTLRVGAVKLVQYLPDGNQRIVRLARDTDVLGLESLLGSSYQHDAIALRGSQLCRFPTRLVRRLSRENPKLHQTLFHRWQQALSEADAWLTQLSTGSARQRVARLLLRLARPGQSGECVLFGREDLGAMLGITTETTSRTIAEFRRQGLLLELEPNRCQLDIRRLTDIANE